MLGSLKILKIEFYLFSKAIEYLPVLVLRLERHQGALFAAGQDVLWGGAVDLLQLSALFLPLTTI